LKKSRKAAEAGRGVKGSRHSGIFAMAMVITITAHPAFVQARTPRFGHDHGRITERTKWGYEALRMEDVFTLSQELQAAARGQDFAAIQARHDYDLLKDAYRRYRDFWSVAQACTGTAS
jgi:ribosomal protein L15